MFLAIVTLSLYRLAFLPSGSQFQFLSSVLVLLLNAMDHPIAVFNGMMESKEALDIIFLAFFGI